MASTTELLIKILAEISDLKSGLDEAGSKLGELKEHAASIQSAFESSSSNIVASLGEIATGIGGVISVLSEVAEATAAAFAVEKVIEFEEKVTNANLGLEKLATALHMDTESAQVFENTAKLFGNSTDSIAQAFQKLERSMIAAQDPTSKAASAFESLHIKLQNADGTMKSAHEVFLELGDAMRRFKDDQSGIADTDVYDILGRRMRDLQMAMENWRATEALMDQDVKNMNVDFDVQRETLADTHQAFVRFGNALTELGQAIGTAFGPSFSVIADDLREITEWLVKAIAPTKDLGDKAREASPGLELFRIAIKGIVGLWDAFVLGCELAGRGFIALVELFIAGGNTIISMCKMVIDGAVDMWKAIRGDTSFSGIKGDVSDLKTMWTNALTDIGKQAQELWTHSLKMAAGLLDRPPPKPGEFGTTPAPEGGGGGEGGDGDGTPDKRINIEKDVKAWEEGLKQKKQAEGNFYTDSKAEDVEYWQTILANIKGDGAVEQAERAAVNDKLFAAEKGAHLQELQDYTANMQLQIAQAGKNTSLKMKLVDEELAHLKAIGAQGTTAYHAAEMERVRIQQEATRANKAALNQELADYKNMIQQKLAAAKGNLTEQKKIIDEAVAYMEAAGQKETAAYRQMKLEQVRIAKEAEDEKNKIAEDGVNTRIKVMKMEMQIQKMHDEERLAISDMTNQEAVAHELRMVDEIYQAELGLLQKERDLYAQGTLEYEKAQNKITLLAKQHEVDRANIIHQGVMKQIQEYQMLASSIGNMFSTTISSMLTEQQTWQQRMISLLNMIADEFATFVGKLIEHWILHELAKSIVTTQQSSIRAAITGAEGDSALGVLAKVVGEWLFGETAKTAATEAAAVPAIATAAAEKAAYASEGATAAGASVAAIPVTGWTMAPAVFASTAALLSAPLDVGAWNVPTDLMAPLHRGEMVVPEAFASGLRSGGNDNQAASSGTVNINISAIDTQSGMAFLKSNASTIVSTLKAQMRNGVKFA